MRWESGLPFLVELYPIFQVAWYYFQDLFLVFVRAENSLGLLRLTIMSNRLKANACENWKTCGSIATQASS